MVPTGHLFDAEGQRPSFDASARHAAPSSLWLPQPAQESERHADAAEVQREEQDSEAYSADQNLEIMQVRQAEKRAVPKSQEEEEEQSDGSYKENEPDGQTWLSMQLDESLHQ